MGSGILHIGSGLDPTLYAKYPTPYMQIPDPASQNPSPFQPKRLWDISIPPVTSLLCLQTPAYCVSFCSFSCR